MKPESVTIVANGQEKAVSPPCNVAEFVSAHGWRATQVVVEYNGRVLGRAEFGQTMLKNGDSLEVIVPVAGG